GTARVDDREVGRPARAPQLRARPRLHGRGRARAVPRLRDRRAEARARIAVGSRLDAAPQTLHPAPRPRRDRSRDLRAQPARDVRAGRAGRGRGGVRALLPPAVPHNRRANRRQLRLARGNGAALRRAATGLGPRLHPGRELMTLATMERDPNVSDKQFLVHLHRQGHLNRLQLQACAKRYEELRQKGLEAALDVVLKEFDAGEIRVSVTAAARAQPPTIDDVPKGESPKQALIWLMQKGSLSRKEAQAAAKLMGQFAESGKPVQNLRGLRNILRLIGAARALPPGELENFEVARAEAKALAGALDKAVAGASLTPEAPEAPEEPEAPEGPEEPEKEPPPAAEEKPRRPGRAPRAPRASKE